MPTDDERRAVARRLREANVRREFYSPWCRMVESVLDGTDCGEDDGTCDENACCERFMKRMADLVDHQTQCQPERTCRPEKRWKEYSEFPYYVCSECGEPLNYRETEDDYEILPYGAGCGAKVIE